MTALYDIHKLTCVHCGSKDLAAAPELLRCKACNKTCAVVDGMPILLRDDSVKTKLETIDYDAVHGVNENTIHIVTENWKTVFNEFRVPAGEIMELGAGTGVLTHTLAHALSPQAVHVTDISAKLLATARQRIADSRARSCFYVCDANHLPFVDNSFDAIVGHSVLHHFLDYEAIIARIHSLLKPGGAAIFFEPTLQGKAKIAMMLQLVTMIDARSEKPLLTEDEKNAIQTQRRHLVKSLEIKNDRAKLAGMEDKYIFDIPAMKRRGLASGYTHVHYRNWTTLEQDIQVGFEQHLLMSGIPKETIRQFAFIARAWDENMVRLLPDEQYSPMGFFIFLK